MIADAFAALLVVSLVAVFGSVAHTVVRAVEKYENHE